MGEDASLHAATAAARAFAGGAAVGSVAPLGAGLIHRTYSARLADDSGRELVVQQLNTDIFGAPEALMDNLVRITRHLRARAEADGISDLDRRVLAVAPAANGSPLFRADDGCVWRAFPRIARGAPIDTAPRRDQLRAAAAAFGRFGRGLTDLPGPPLVETIPDFHDFAARKRAFDNAVGEDRCGRLETAREDFDALRGSVDQLEAALPTERVASLPRRVAHHDCKLDNLLFDAKTGDPLCVLDLDTTMPGHWLSDFGELVRSATSRSAESDPDRVDFELDAFAALAEGYCETVGALLTAEERSALPLAGAHLALMNALRFATDHLEGDVYFRLLEPGQNLARARTQQRLAGQMLSQTDALHEAFAAALPD